ncbi:enoyl-CoA hydratase/isomerase family protein [Paraburkholderia susongensis]|uniref:Short chain enoyl-CoA hydratase /Enoyl-CoA hydratase n=1 Tax=Paraburkholderia susongensis TaxID=1515439 RepID=A0A1X7KKS0_9BURK|nr:enoyl-CoA hydratase/isomerase family protein [Paraburkholderia susongensis]SMG42035.1 short chain enoyl-CoA hydratase /Enoyl-CoA hydratase [Paraburkholderia susongensis]
MPSIDHAMHDGTLVLTIDNPAKRNAFTYGMTQALGAHLEAAERDPVVKCVVITGTGDVAFSSGHDLNEMLAHQEHASDPSLNEPFLLPARMRTPTIAAINGFSLAAGFILALNCDFRVCASNARFAAPGARIGLLPIGGQLSRLPALMPHAIAHELLVTCRDMHADEAYRVGFANRLVEPGGALDAALDMAAGITRQSTGVVREVKAGLELLLSDGAAAAGDHEWRMSAELQQAPDAVEGVRAFLEKRAPNFQ